MIGGKLGLSQKLKTKQVFIAFDWKEGTDIKEEKWKVILDLLSVIYDFEEKKKTFLSSIFHALIIFWSFPSLEAILPRQIASYIIWSKLTLQPKMQEMPSKCVLKLEYIGLIL